MSSLFFFDLLPEHTGNHRNAQAKRSKTEKAEVGPEGPNQESISSATHQLLKDESDRQTTCLLSFHELFTFQELCSQFKELAAHEFKQLGPSKNGSCRFLAPQSQDLSSNVLIVSLGKMLSSQKIIGITLKSIRDAKK